MNEQCDSRLFLLDLEDPDGKWREGTSLPGDCLLGQTMDTVKIPRDEKEEVGDMFRWLGCFFGVAIQSRKVTRVRELGWLVLLVGLVGWLYSFIGLCGWWLCFVELQVVRCGYLCLLYTSPSPRD